LVVDTSVAINLYATGAGERILSALPNEILVPEIVIRDLDHDHGRKTGEYEFLLELISKGRVKSVKLNDSGWFIFEKLASAASSIGDGEASVIAVASSLGVVPVLDDAKARAYGPIHTRGTLPAWSLDILVHPFVEARLGPDSFADSIYLALQNGRMRIDEERCQPVVELIGIEHALKCPCLPNFKMRQLEWMSILGR
jgi:predicted nucleic acid-binding protein